MFRRQRKPPAPARFPRPIVRRANVSDPENPPELEFASKIESGVRGSLAFFTGAASILARLVYAPHRLERHADPQGRLSPSVPPFTFLTLCAFIATTAFRALFAVGMLVWLMLTRSCAAETEDPVELPHLGELFRLPSVEDVLTRGLATVLLIIGVLALLRAFVAWRRSSEAARRFFTLALYIAGWQSLLAALALGLVVVSWHHFEGLPANNPNIDRAAGVLMPLVILWPALLYALRLGQVLAGDRPSTPLRRVGRWAACSVAGIVTSVLTFLPGLGVAWAMAIGELARQSQAHPLMQVALVADESFGAGDAMRRVTLLVTDAAPRALHLLPGKAWLKRGVGPSESGQRARIASWQGGDERMLTIEPGRSAWVVLEFENCPDRASADCGLKLPQQPASAASGTLVPNSMRRWVFVDLNYPVPETASGLVTFGEVKATGERRDIQAFVRGRMER